MKPARYLLFAAVIVVFSSLFAVVALAETGMASFYGPGFHGRRTASGERFNQHGMTCAHRTAHFGTRLRVTRLDNGRSIVCRTNDRGPYVRGRIVDLSLGAARKLGMVRRGVVRVRVTVVR